MLDTCPVWGSDNITRLRRITGYLSVSYLKFNNGKVQECLDREKHSKYSDK
jgi:ribonucleoside-triphosphate reductase